MDSHAIIFTTLGFQIKLSLKEDTFDTIMTWVKVPRQKTTFRTRQTDWEHEFSLRFTPPFPPLRHFPPPTSWLAAKKLHVVPIVCLAFFPRHMTPTISVKSGNGPCQMLAVSQFNIYYIYIPTQKKVSTISKTSPRPNPNFFGLKLVLTLILDPWISSIVKRQGTSARVKIIATSTRWTRHLQPSLRISPIQAPWRSTAGAKHVLGRSGVVHFP